MIDWIEIKQKPEKCFGSELQPSAKSHCITEHIYQVRPCKLPLTGRLGMVLTKVQLFKKIVLELHLT